MGSGSRRRRSRARPADVRARRPDDHGALRKAGVVAAGVAVGFAIGAGLWWLSGDSERAALVGGSDPGPVHVHGLGVNPADSSLFIATHTGLWRVPAGASRAERVGDSRQDTMGFTVVGPDHFLGSGHPDPRQMREQGLPPHLGLIESRDAAKTWKPISLLGEADFHVLRADGRTIYGYDASNDRLLRSGDGGRSWQQRERPSPLVDLAVHPRDSRRLIAASETGLHASSDGGSSWRALGDAVGLLAWPEPARLFLVDGRGDVYVSRDAGRSWRRVGEVGGEPAALLATSPRELYAALHDGTVKRSRDGGRRWTIRSTA